MYKPSDQKRESDRVRSVTPDQSDYRTCWRRDYARLIHSPSFRRLQGKTQLFPGIELDYFRNRLTHSLEVAQIAKSIAFRINHEFLKGRHSDHHINPDIVEFAGLAHDLGHPPFGHQGEEALDECMIDHGGFEGNAQTLRILAKLEKKVALCDGSTGINPDGEDMRAGLDLTYRSLASILKYDTRIPFSKEERNTSRRESSRSTSSVLKGYYDSEGDLVNNIKSAICSSHVPEPGSFKTIECSIMDIADDIAYSTYDLEDAMKAGFINPLSIVFSDAEILENVANKLTISLNREVSIDEVKDTLMTIFRPTIDNASIKGLKLNPTNYKHAFLLSLSISHSASQELATNGYLRTSFTSELINRIIVDGINFKYNSLNPALSSVSLNDNERMQVEVLKKFNYESQILSPRLRIVEFRGKEIVKKIFLALSDSSGKGVYLLPDDVRQIFTSINHRFRMRVICDFIAGMTDRYAIEFYGRLTSEKPETIFKPI